MVLHSPLCHTEILLMCVLSVRVEGHFILNINPTQFKTERGKKKDSVWGKRDKKEGKRIEKSRNTERTRTEIKWGKFLLLLILFSVLVSTFFLFHSPVALFDLLGNHFSCSVVSLTFFFPINYYSFYINALNPLYMIF